MYRPCGTLAWCASPHGRKLKHAVNKVLSSVAEQALRDILSAAVSGTMARCVAAQLQAGHQPIFFPQGNTLLTAGFNLRQ